MNKFLFPYKVGSKSCGALSKKLGAKRIKHENSKFKAKPNQVLINWGSSKLPQEALKCVKIFNHPDTVSNATNKLTFFRQVEKYNEGRDDKVVIPPFTTNLEEAIGWERTIVARQKLTGHSGEGIVLFEPHEEGVEAPLYVQYIPKKEEYRAHVIGGKVVSVQRKARRIDVNNGDVNWRVRNHKNGFIFARNEDHEAPEMVSKQALLACEATQLDFGAVDILYNEHRNTAYVLEVNCAPGLEGTTLQEYSNRFEEMIGNL